MAKNKALEDARKAYNKSKSTKYRVQSTGKKTKKKEQKVKSHYGGVSNKTQNTEENREESRSKTKSVVRTVKSNISIDNTTDKKPQSSTPNKRNGTRSGAVTPVSTKQKEKSAGAVRARENDDVKKAVKPKNIGGGKVTDYVNSGERHGTATGGLAKAYNTGRTLQQRLEDAGKKKVQTVTNEQLTAEQKQAADRAKRSTRFYTQQLIARGKMTQEEADKAVKTAEKNAIKGVKEDHTLEYSNATKSNEYVQREATSSNYANTKVEDKEEKERAIKEARFYTNREVAAGNMTQEEADKIVRQAGKGHYTSQSANILNQLGGKGTAEKVGTEQAGAMSGSKFASGVMQGLSYGDNTRTIGKYNKQAAELVDTTKASGAFNTGYMIGQAGQFMLGGTNKMTDALVKGVTKTGAMRSSLNIGLRKGAADMMFETPINTLDALKMSTDANGNFDGNAFVKYMALNSGLSGGMGGVIGGAGSKLAKSDAKDFISLSAKINSGAGLSAQEMERFGKLQKKFESIRQGNDVAKTDIVNKADYDAEVGKKVFEKGGSVDDALKVVNGGGTHTEKIGYANSIKETANSQFEQLRVAREQMLEQARNASPEEAKVLRREASKLSSEISRLGEIANVAEKQLAIELKRNKKAVTELTQNMKNMSEATGVNYRVVTDKDMRKLIKEAGGDVSDDYFYKGFYYKNKNGETEILVNADSPQAHQTVIGHETGHLIKTANEKEFDDLGNMLESYAKKQGDFDAVYNQLKRSYPEATEAELREEVTCELLGKYVYGADDKFIKQLAGEKPSVIQKIIDYFKKLLDGTSDKEMAKELKAIIDKTEGLVKNIDTKESGESKFAKEIVSKADEKKYPIAKSQEMVDKAKEMEAEYYSPERIHEETDLFKDSEGRWREKPYNLRDDFDMLSDEEYVTIRNEVFKRNAEIGNYDSVKDGTCYTENHFVRFTTYGGEDFDVKKTYLLDGTHRKEIDDVVREVRSDAESIDSRIEAFRSRTRNNNADNSIGEHGRESGQDDRLARGESRGNGRGDSGQSGGIESRVGTDILKKYSKEKPADAGSFNAHREELLSDAEESYGAKYTDDFNETGFIFPDGKLPKMGDYGQRGDDHAIVVSLYDAIDYATSQTPKADAMGRFLDEGNIRIMPENGSIEMSAKVKPTQEQFDSIRRFLREHDEAEIEFSGRDGRSVDSKRYTDGVNAEQVINDIKRFYSEGKIGGSDLNNFRFSKQKREGAPAVAHIVEDITGDSRFHGDAKQFAKDIDELANIIREKKDPLGKVDEILDKHIKINEFEEVGEAIDPNVKQLIKSSAINISELGDGTIAHKLENIGLSKADVPSWVQLRSKKGGRPLDRVYQELSDDRPDLFPPDASHEDKLLKIIEATKQEPEMARRPQEWIDGERADLGADLLDRVGEVIDAEKKVKPEVKETPKVEKPKAEKPKEKKPKEPEKTEVQKVRENDFASDNVKTALDDIEKAGVYTAEAEKKAKRFNELDRQIAKETKHIENARKSEKYATEAERAERVAELEDNLQSLKNKQARIAGEIEQMGKMKAVDDSITAGEQIKELRGDVKVNKELKNTDNLTKTDNWIKDKWLSVRRLWEDSLIDVEKAAKESGDLKLRGQILTAANRVRNSMSEANTWITKHRKSFDNKVGGKSLDEIFNKELIENEPKYADFQEYLIMKHVPARHAKGTDIYPEVSPELAEKRVKELEDKYRPKDKDGNPLLDKDVKPVKSEVEIWAQDVYDYINDLQKYRVDSGMLSKEAAEQFAKDYPFYVPTNRVNDEAIDFFSGGVSNGIRSAKGGDNDVLDMYSQLYTATNKTIHAAEENQMLNLYFKAKGVTEDQLKDATLEDLEHAVIEAKVNKKTGTANVSFFVDGKPVRLPCNHQLALGLREMDGLEFERLMKAAKVATLYGKPFKALVTDWNLVFGVRNGARDLQQALVNSKDTRYFGSSMGAAAHSIANADAPYRKLYASMGGEQAQLVSYDAVAKQMGIEKQGKVDAIHEKVQEFVDLQAKGKHVNPIHYIEGINGAIEMMPRMCEFIGTLRKEADKMLKQNGSSLKQLRKEIVEECKKDSKIGASNLSAEVENRLAQKVIDMVGKDTIDTAMRNANDITLNFGRSGVLGKALNMGFVPYLNPSIQGLSKLVRLFTEAGQEGGWKALASIGMKLGTFTIAPAVFNELLLKDNEDFQNLNTRDKDNNFFIPLSRFGEEWDGKFLKFPKPRENAVLAEPVEYALRYFLNDSEYAYFDMGKLKNEKLWEKIPLTDEGKQSFRTAIDNIGVINPATSNMLSPLWQTFHNKTWYGGNIESAYESSINEETGKPNVPVNERYDVGTSGIAIALGQTSVAKSLNLSPKKIDNILDSYTGMIYDLGISQTTEEAKTRGNWLFRTMASQFVKDSVFSNKLSTKAWDKMDGMNPQEQKDYKSTYMYDTFKYDDAMDEITADKKLTNKEKMDAKRALMIQKNKLNRQAINGDSNTSNPLVDIAKYLGATKTLNRFLPDTGGKDTDTWADFFKTYKNAKGYANLTSAQKKVESQKFLDVYALGVKGQLKQDPAKFHDSPSWGMTGVAAAQLAMQGKLKEKDANAIMKACGVYESQFDVYHNYAEHDGNVLRYAVTEKRVGKTLDKVGDWGMDKKSGLWQGGFSKTMGAKGGTIAMSLATDKKVQFKDRAYYIANSSDPQMMEKMNAARGFSQKYGHKTKEISQLAIQADALGDGNTYLKNDEIIMACNEMQGSQEEKSMAYILLGGSPKKNPFGAIGNYSIDGDTGIQMLEEENSSGKGGHGHGRRRRRKGGGGGKSSKAKMPNTKSGAIDAKVTDPFSGISRIGGNRSSSASTETKKSNLNEAYRKKVRKLRRQIS